MHITENINLNIGYHVKAEGVKGDKIPEALAEVSRVYFNRMMRGDKLKDIKIKLFCDSAGDPMREATIIAYEHEHRNLHQENWLS